MVKVSVVIPAYNVGESIKESINSILSQNYKDIELIVCDDCSTDNTWNSILDIAKADNRIIALQNKKNLKAAETRNKCIELATGKYIAIQDADDISVASRISKQVYFLENNNEYDFVGSSMFLLNEYGVYATTNRPRTPSKRDFLYGTPFCHGTIVFTKSCIKKVNGYYVSKYTERGQDVDLLMRLYYEGYKGYNIEEPLYYYRLYESSFKKRTIKSILYSAIIRHKNYQKLGLLPKGYIFLFKMVLMGIKINILKR